MMVVQRHQTVNLDSMCLKIFENCRKFEGSTNKIRVNPKVLENNNSTCNFAFKLYDDSSSSLRKKKTSLLLTVPTQTSPRHRLIHISTKVRALPAIISRTHHQSLLLAVHVHVHCPLCFDDVHIWYIFPQFIPRKGTTSAHKKYSI